MSCPYPIGSCNCRIFWPEFQMPASLAWGLSWAQNSLRLYTEQVRKCRKINASLLPSTYNQWLTQIACEYPVFWPAGGMTLRCDFYTGWQSSASLSSSDPQWGHTVVCSYPSLPHFATLYQYFLRWLSIKSICPQILVSKSFGESKLRH